MFGGLDVIVAMLLLIGVFGGAGRGLLGTLIDLFSISFGLIIGSFVYRAPVNLFNHFGISGIAVDLVSYVLSCVVLATGMIILLESLRKKVEIKPAIERIFGGILGIVNGVILASGILIMLSVSSNSGKDIDLGKLSPRVRDVILKAYERMERHNITLPKMIVLPRSYINEFGKDTIVTKFQKFNFTELEGSECISCGGKVLFSGYFSKYGAGLIPKFTCEKCKRTSDGCQTYEGYHKLYGECPVELAKKGQKFDCGNWLNYTLVTPSGPCPVDGKTLDIMLQHEPVPYK